MKIISDLKDWIFEKRHGCNRDLYAIKEWNKVNINSKAYNIRDYFHGFKYIIKVNPDKVLDDHPMIGWCLKDEIQNTYCYPARKLGNHLMYDLSRGIDIDNEYTFEFNDFGYDAVYIATNNRDDAVIISLKYK